MHDRMFNIGAATLSAYVLGLVGTALMIANFFHSPTNDHLGFLGVPFVAAAVATRVRALLCALHGALRDAFDAGREIGRMEADERVRSLR